MKKTIPAIIAAALLVAGCSKGVRAPREYSPLAPKDTLVLCAEDSAAMASNPMGVFLREWGMALQKEVEKFDDMGDAKARETLQSAEYAEKLRKYSQRGKWSVFTIGRPGFAIDELDDDATVPMPAMACVTALRERASTEDAVAELWTLWEPLRQCVTDADEDLNLIENLREAGELSTVTIAGCDVTKLTFKSTEATEELLKHVTGIEPCIGVYDGSLEIIASSPQVFENVVALYSGMAPAAPADSVVARDASLRDCGQVIFGIYGVRDMLAALAGDKLEDVPDEASRYIRSLCDIRITQKLDGEAMSMESALEVSFDDESLPPLLATMCNGGLGMAKAAVAMAVMQTPELAQAATLVNDLNVVAEGRVCRLSVKITKAFIEKLDVAELMRIASEKRKQAAECDDDLFSDEDGDDGEDDDE